VDQISREIRVGSSDKETNALLARIDDAERPFSRHYNQNEDFFLLLPEEVDFPPFKIHHDVHQPEPPREYLSSLRGVLAQAIRLVPQCLKDLVYFFDPAEVLRPCFYHLYRVEESLYLYLLRIDLGMRAAESTVIERGTNDTTPRYRARRLYLEPMVIPLEEAVKGDGSLKGVRVREIISQTWIGERGHGYKQQGIWIDADLTRFFSRLFMPPNHRFYPYWPFLCRYRTVCQSVLDLSPKGRAALIPALHRALGFVAPAMERIQAVVRSEIPPEKLPLFQELKGRIPAPWYAPWEKVRVEAYLNDQEMKEYRIEG
jgi:hypothetical protein